MNARRSFMLNFRHAFAATLLLLLPVLASCRVGYPFRGPGYDAERGVIHPDATEKVLVTVTRGDIQPGGGKDFTRELNAVLDSMNQQDGLIGYSVRKQLIGSRVWTMSVWIDRASMERFVYSPAHRKAIVDGGIPRESFVTVTTLVEAVRIPLTWPEAERMLTEMTSEE